MMRKSLAALAVLVGLSVATPAAAQGACTRESLQTIADSWKRAIEQGTMMTMSLGEWVDYNGNGRRGSLGAFLDHPREVVHHIIVYIIDPKDPRKVSNWPDFNPQGRPRSATVAIRKDDGGVIGT